MTRECRLLDIKKEGSIIRTTVLFNDNEYVLETGFKANPDEKKAMGLYAQGKSAYMSDQPIPQEKKLNPMAWVLQNAKYTGIDGDKLTVADKKFIENTLLVWAEGNINSPILNLFQ